MLLHNFTEYKWEKNIQDTVEHCYLNQVLFHVQKTLCKMIHTFSTFIHNQYTYQERGTGSVLLMQLSIFRSTGLEGTRWVTKARCLQLWTADVAFKEVCWASAPKPPHPTGHRTVPFPMSETVNLKCNQSYVSKKEDEIHQSSRPLQTAGT